MASRSRRAVAQRPVESNVDPDFAALSARQRQAIDRAFDRGLVRSTSKNRHKGRTIPSDGPSTRDPGLSTPEAGGFIDDDAGGFLDEGGFVREASLEDVGGGYVEDSGGGFVDDAGASDDDGNVSAGGFAKDHGDTDNLSSSATVPLRYLPHLLSSLGLPSDEDVLAVFRASASGWDDTDAGRRRGRAESTEPDLVVHRRDFRAVCAALVGPDEGLDGALVEPDADEEAFLPSDSDNDIGVDEEYEDGTEAPPAKKRGRRRKGLTVTGPVKLSGRQRELAKDIWEMLKPGSGGKGILGRDEVKTVARSMAEMWSEDEITEMVSLFSSQHEARGLSFEDFGAVMLRANLTSLWCLQERASTIRGCMLVLSKGHDKTPWESLLSTMLTSRDLSEPVIHITMHRGEQAVLAATLGLKLLLYPAYTDFEVHRNWLAITYHLPWSRWYYDTTSEWTLDYPPFFAYFSYVLSLPARFRPMQTPRHVLALSSTAVQGWEVTAYMRTTVLVTELVLLFGLLRLARSSVDPNARFVALAVFLHPGFLVLDNIHFQYNAFLFGIMVWSLVAAKERRPASCAAAFAALLMFKHIYVYLAPAWFCFLLRAYCIPPSTGLILQLRPLLAIGTVTLAVFALALGPFLAAGQGAQLMSRLFPFTRGLMHAYWAPNAWAGVTLFDRMLLQRQYQESDDNLTLIPVSKRFNVQFAVAASGVASTSRGLVGDTHFAILPNIKPVHCFALTAVTQALIPLFQRPTYTSFLKSITACGFSSFMFGWHVHEKAIMLVLVPLSLLAHEDVKLFEAFEAASVAGIISLFPLLFQPQETLVKMGYTLIWALVVFKRLRSALALPASGMWSNAIASTQTAYLTSAVPLLVYTSIVHPALTASGRLSERAEFLPLLLTSIWCSAGLWLAWGRLQWALWSPRTVEVKVE